MTYLAGAIALIWLAVTLVLVGRQMNLMRLTLNNLAPGADFWSPECTALRKQHGGLIDPKFLNVDGRSYLKQWNWIACILGAWIVAGFFLGIWVSTWFVPLTLG